MNALYEIFYLNKFQPVRFEVQPSQKSKVKTIEAISVAFAYINGLPTGQKPGWNKIYLHEFISAN